LLLTFPVNQLAVDLKDQLVDAISARVSSPDDAELARCSAWTSFKRGQTVDTMRADVLVELEVPELAPDPESFLQASRITSEWFWGHLRSM
jgi:hypothetical protein